MTRRLFVALELPEALRARLASLPPDLPGLRRVPPRNLHLTLYFIGTRASAAPVHAALAGVDAAPVTLALRGVGRWSGVLWAGLSQDAALTTLQQRVNRALADCGLEPDARPFRPHITLGRFRAQRPPAGLDTWLRAQRSLRSAPAPVHEFCLYDSELSPAGARYRILQRYPLRAEATV